MWIIVVWILGNASYKLLSNNIDFRVHFGSRSSSGVKGGMAFSGQHAKKQVLIYCWILALKYTAVIHHEPFVRKQQQLSNVKHG